MQSKTGSGAAVLSQMPTTRRSPRTAGVRNGIETTPRLIPPGALGLGNGPWTSPAQMTIARTGFQKLARRFNVNNQCALQEHGRWAAPSPRHQAITQLVTRIFTVDLSAG